MRKASAFVPALLYNAGRVISYTLIGAILGTISMIAYGTSGVVLPAMAGGILKMAAGLLMVIMGVNMLGLFPGLSRLVPRMPAFLNRKAEPGSRGRKSPLVVGLANGLMPCGPLQSMQIVALASGNPLTGALSMLVFSAGTVPLMLGLGSLVSALGQKFARQIMNVGAVLVTVLGLAMLSQGGSLSGLLSARLLLSIIFALGALGTLSRIPFRFPRQKTVAQAAAFALAVVIIIVLNARPAGGAADSANGSVATIENGAQLIASTLTPGRYPNISVKAGTPVRWTIDAPPGSLNGCNSRLVIPEYELQVALQEGENVIEFVPDKSGNFGYSCWMGMIRGAITVTEA
jgi:sulfite exporter TauE/SafE